MFIAVWKIRGLDQLDLMQFHTWNDEWMRDDRWFYRLDDMRSQKLINAIGISINRWEPWNGVRAVRSGQIDAVQVIYNIFDQNPEDELFPACREMNVAVIARVPFDEGTLTGTLTKDSKWPEGDWRNTYFVPENLIPSVERADAVKKTARGVEPGAAHENHDAGARVAFYSRQRRREHDHSRHAKTLARGIKHRSQRRGTIASKSYRKRCAPSAGSESPRRGPSEAMQ